MWSCRAREWLTYISATVVDVVGVLTLLRNQSVLTRNGMGPGGPVAQDVDPAKQDFDIAGKADDFIIGRDSRTGVKEFH